VRRSCLIVGFLCCLLGRLVCGAETFQLTTGESVTGEVLTSSANDLGVQIKIEEGNYQRVLWTSFSQEDLKKFAENPKMKAYVEPFIEETPAERMKKTEVKVKEPPRLSRPVPQSLVGAMFSTGLGLFILLVLYAANIYAGYEVSIFRAQPVALVCGLSAIPVLGLAAPIVFLALPTKMPPREAEPEAVPAAEAVPGEAGAAQATGDAALNPMAVEGAAHPSGLKLAHSEAGATKTALPATVTFQRGQFTFNRRFFETKFPGFFSVVRRDADRDMVLVIKSARGQYVGQRISRIAANDLHLQVQKGPASEEVLIPFAEVQEIQLKHKDA